MVENNGEKFAKHAVKALKICGYLLLVASVLMFFSSVALYLLIRKVQLRKVSINLYSLFMFLVPAIGTGTVLLFSPEGFLISLKTISPTRKKFLSTATLSQRSVNILIIFWKPLTKEINIFLKKDL